MGSPKTKGRMINKEISDSKRFARLSPEAAVLFCMLIPHYNSYGKLNGDPGYIKGEVCPRVEYLTIKNIPKYLEEITKNTSVKWFEFNGRHWIHSIKFLSDHQNLKVEKLGQDLLPTYSGLTPELVPSEVEVEVEVEEEVEEEGYSGLGPGVTPPSGGRSPSKLSFGEFGKVLLTEDELKKLNEKFGEEGTKDRITDLDTAIESKGLKYKSHYATILNWDRRNEGKGKSGKSKDSDKEEFIRRAREIKNERGFV